MAGALGGWTIDVAAGWRGARDGAVSSTRRLNLEGTRRPTGISGFDVAGGGGTVAADTVAAGGTVTTSCVRSVSLAGGSPGEDTTVSACGATRGSVGCSTRNPVVGTTRGSVGCSTRNPVVGATRGLAGCSTRNPVVGTTRGLVGGAVTGSTGGTARSVAVADGGVSICGPARVDSLGVAAASCGSGAWTSDSSSPPGISGGMTFGDLIRRGRPRRWGIAGVGVFAPFPPLRPLLDGADFCENNGPAGRSTSRVRAVRWTNCRATISSIEPDALLTSMPCSRLSRSMTS